MINLPAFYEFYIDDDFVNFFNDKMKDYEKNNYLEGKNDTATVNGKQTKNILELNDNETNKKLNSLIELIENKSKCKLKYQWVHLVRYNKEGYQDMHRHDYNEDISLIIYLNTCTDGKTEFLINEKRKIKFFRHPEKGKCIMFLSSISHRALPSSENKTVLVLGFRLN